MARKLHALSEELRRQLRGLGISDRRHTAEGLSSEFPPEFKIQEAGLDLDALAKALIHFTKKGLIGRRRP